MIDVDGWDYVTWEYQKWFPCPVCEPQTGQSMMKLIDKGMGDNSWTSCFKCLVSLNGAEGCGLEVIVHHTFSIDCVEVKE